jgi:putative CocE/NonD family hydrolase
MRDGVQLDATVWRPMEPGRYPVILERMGYELMGRCAVNAEYYARRGYVFVGQNTRGSYDSEGVYDWTAADGWGERRDGYDTVEWAGTQTWSTGKVGMLDGSYSGITQYLVAPTRPPHLQALFVRQAATLSYATVFRGGAFPLLWLGAITRHVLADLVPPGGASPIQQEARARLQQAVEELASWERHLPLKHFPPLIDIPAGRRYFELLAHPNDGPWWWEHDLSRRYAEIDVPIFHFASWFDLFLGPQLDHFQGVRAQTPSPRCRRAQRLVIGPWIHAPENVGNRQVGELDFGPRAELDLAAFRLPWFDYWLKGIDNGVFDGPPVRAFLMGANRWLDFDAWPPEEVTYKQLYLHAGAGWSDASLNGGAATFERPESTEPPDVYSYDPEQPVPSLVAFPDFGPHDYRALEQRMLTYTTTPLEQELVIVGPVRAMLYASSSAPDTDWVVRMCDVYPDGRSMSVCDGILRGRYRDSTQRPELMEPGKIYQFEVDLWATAQSFPRGHRLRVELTSSDFPRYERNLNTGGPLGEEVSGRVAVNVIYHDSAHPSHVVLPVFRSSTAEIAGHQAQSASLDRGQP